MALTLVSSGCANGGAAQASVTTPTLTPSVGDLVIVYGSCYSGTGDDTSVNTISNSGTAQTWTLRETISQGALGVGTVPPQPLSCWTTQATSTSFTVTTGVGGGGTGFAQFVYWEIWSGHDTTTPVADTDRVLAGSGTPQLNMTAPVSGCAASCLCVDWGSTGQPNFTAEAGTTLICAVSNSDIQPSATGRKTGLSGAFTIGMQALSSPAGTNIIGITIQPAAAAEANATMDVTLPVPTATMDADAIAAAAMDVTLPMVTATFDADAVASATMDVTLPVPVAAFDVDAVAGAVMDVTLPVPSATLGAEAVASAAMNVTLPMPAAAMDADVTVSAAMDVTLPMPIAGFTADNEAESTDLFSSYSDRLLTCLCSQWPDGNPLKPARCCFRFDGDTPTMGIALNEDECKCGTAWVRVVDWYVSSDNAFPGPTSDVNEQNCPMMWALVLEMGVGRCPPTGDERDLPSCDELNAFHATVMDDGRRLRNAVYCCFNQASQLDRFVLGNPERLGPQGKCFQQTLTVTVMVMNCNEC